MAILSEPHLMSSSCPNQLQSLINLASLANNVLLPSVQQEQQNHQRIKQRLLGRLNLIQQQPKQSENDSMLLRLLVPPSSSHLAQKLEPLSPPLHKQLNSAGCNGQMLDSLMQLLIVNNQEQKISQQRPRTVSLQSSPLRKESQKVRIPLTSPKELCLPAPFTSSNDNVKRVNNDNMLSHAEQKPRHESCNSSDTISVTKSGDCLPARTIYSNTNHVKPNCPVALKNLYPKDKNGFSIIPCNARARPKDHNHKTAFFRTELEKIKHGDELSCSDSACSNTGVKFLWCSTCCSPVAKRNFKNRHAHNESGTYNSSIPRAVRGHAENSFQFCQEGIGQILSNKRSLEQGRKRRREENVDTDEEASNCSDHHDVKKKIMFASLLNSPVFVQASNPRIKGVTAIALSSQTPVALCTGQLKVNEAREHSFPKTCTVNSSILNDAGGDRNGDSMSKPNNKDEVNINLREQMWHDLLNNRPPHNSQGEPAVDNNAMSKWLLRVLTISDENKSMKDLAMLEM
eukprot:CAMPEP_0194393090 /NCGR_PEP_ID=MMETSP0174-20130528/123100_1 /TAXON_ID=216777 /ORGANISM="Proboscia alata, Strain PI-D3" /LENGTH=513 /DNA_ID=CAMNT_0039188729 /DNA_START=583 /DNA_END=2124 /DNA_ORIENTATION=-